MEKIILFIKRRWLIFIVFFFASSVFFYNLTEKKEVFYRTEADIVFIGADGSFNLALAAKRLQDKEFLADTAGGVNLLVADLKRNLKLDFKDKNTITVSFISPDATQTREVVFRICNQFAKERDAVIKKLKEKEETTKRELKARYDEANASRNDLNLIKQKFDKLKQDNSRVDKERSGLEDDMAKLILQKEDMLRVFTEKHPDVITLTDKIDSVRSQIAKLPDNAPLYKKFAVMIETKEQEFLSRNRAYEELRANMPANEKYWHAEVIEKPSSYPLLVGRKKQWYYKWDTIISFIVSILGCLIAEAGDKRIYTRKEAQARLRIPIANEIQKAMLIKKKFFSKGADIKPVFSRIINSKVLKNYEKLYSFLKMDVFRGQMDKKVIHISSSEPETGKSFTACCLALVAAKNGNKTLLADLNLRHPSIDMFFGLRDNPNGISDILRGRTAKESAVINLTSLLLSAGSGLSQENISGLDKLNILLSGAKVENPLELLGTQELIDLFKDLSNNCGLLILDTSSLRHHTDSLNLMSLADAVILVERRGRSSYPLIEDAIYRIKNVGGTLKGLVLSSV